MITQCPKCGSADGFICRFTAKGDATFEWHGTLIGHHFREVVYAKTVVCLICDQRIKSNKHGVDIECYEGKL